MTASELAHAVFDKLLADGVRDVVVCPGSRSGPLALAAYDADRAGRITLHVRTDERTAGFLALGLTKGSRRDAEGRHRPTAVVCTSGTAVANLHPAVLEAAHTGLPLVVVSADRPARLRGTGANQTTDQVALFGDAAVAFDVAAPADLPEGSLLPLREGPVQLNMQLDEPLLPDGVGSYVPGAAVAIGPAVGDGPRPEIASRLVLSDGPRTVVVAGDDAGPAARRLAEHGGWPLLAEPSSGSRTGGHAILRYRLLLDGPLGQRVERVVVQGHPTLSRPVSRLLSRTDVEVVSVPPQGRWPRRPHRVDAEATVVEPPRAAASFAGASPWLEEWQRADREAGRRLDTLLKEHSHAVGLIPHTVAREVAVAVRPGDQLVIGSSQPARDLDLVAPAYPVGERRKVLANRGLAGIDGTVSTAIGVALTRPGAHTFALLGDLTFLHDATGLMIGPDEPRPDLTLVVVNDDGGAIFSTLEQGAPAYSSAFERVFGTPTGVDLAALCAATRTPHWRVESLPELRQALASPHGGPRKGIEVVEARVDRSGRRALEDQIRALTHS